MLFAKREEGASSAVNVGIANRQWRVGPRQFWTN